ncbi:unnamed protein product [Ilex paraguariensis]|uniref:EF-hand domain-containing protein n=1 Tax=Ilex paraguariensis TaxID=185542 RepID=A0ABC8TVW3_9AQUA
MSLAMSITHLNQFPTEKIIENSHTVPPSIWMVGLVHFLLLRLIFYLFRKFGNFFSRYHSFIQSQLNNLKSQTVKKDQDFEPSMRYPKTNENIDDDDDDDYDDGSLCRDEVEMVMTKLGIFCHPEDEKLQERLGSDDVTNLFDEKEPSLEEVKGAFYVFDENRDGFIDAMDLQRVLCALGLKEGLEIENCRMMIREFDENEDDRIDFIEFVKLMNN